MITITSPASRQCQLSQSTSSIDGRLDAARRACNTIAQHGAWRDDVPRLSWDRALAACNLLNDRVTTSTTRRKFWVKSEPRHGSVYKAKINTETHGDFYSQQTRSACTRQEEHLCTETTFRTILRYAVYRLQCCNPWIRTNEINNIKIFCDMCRPTEYITSRPAILIPTQKINAEIWDPLA